MGLRITTWNVNGIRNPFGYQPWRDKRTFDAMFDALEADIVVMQELKIQRKDLRDDMVLVPGWDCYFSLPKHKKGYSGVGIYTRQSVCAPIRAEEGLLGVLCPPDPSLSYSALPSDKSIGGYPTAEQVEHIGVDPATLDAEGRCVVLEFPAFVLFGVYSPANSNGQRDDFRYGFLTALDTRIRNLNAMGKRVILTGDLNVSRNELDTAGAEDDMRKQGLTREEYISTPNRRIFNQLIEDGDVVGHRDQERERPVLWDICRGFHPTRRGMFTHWEQKINARPGNYGSRIDYILCSIEMKSWFAESNIQEGLMGSDHCPVYAILKQKISVHGREEHIYDVMNPSGMFRDGLRQRPYSVKEIPAFSGKLLPEFDKRRNIKDMFARKPSLANSTSTVAPNEPLDVSSAASDTLVNEAPSDSSIPSQTPSLSQTATASPLVSVLPASAARNGSPNKKRHATDASPAKAMKRGKSNASTVAPSGPASAKGQQTLKGFFKPKSTLTAPNGDSTSGTHEDGDSPPPMSGPDPSAPSTPPPHLKSTDPDGPSPPIPSPSDILSEAPTVNASPAPHDEDPELTKSTWKSLFTKPTAPRCEGHNEPCRSYVTKKKGFHTGRSFWTCARPLGPSGNKEKGTQWRCHTFIWASDWSGRDG